MLVDLGGWCPIPRHPARRRSFPVGVYRDAGFDETAFLNVTRHRHTTNLTSIDSRRLIDITPVHGASDLGLWCSNVESSRLFGISVVAADFTDSHRSAVSNHLADAEVVADAFNLVRVAKLCLDDVRRRFQRELMGHRGRKADSLYRIPSSSSLDSSNSTRTATQDSPWGFAMETPRTQSWLRGW